MKNYIRNVFFFVMSVLFTSQSFSQDIYMQNIDSIANRFYRQSILYPQEKIYLQTDKSFYIVGENIWFRAHLINAQNHLPDSTSRYVYVELINPLNEVVKQVKVKMINGAYQGYVPLAEDLPDGEYSVRCYTRYMENMGEEYFFRRGIRIGGVLSALYRTEASFFYDKDKKIRVELNFKELAQDSSISPERIKIYSSKERYRTVRPDNDGIARIKVKESELVKGSIYIEWDYNNKLFKQYITATLPDDDYDVSFFPEGGNMVENTLNRVAFKALNSDGYGEDVTGVIVDEAGNEMGHIQSVHLGMGYFLYVPKKETKAHAIFRNNRGVEKKVKLPEGDPNTYSLQAKWSRGNLLVSAGHSPDKTQADSLYLIVLCRGMPAFASPWDSEKDGYKIQEGALPTGVLQLLLVDRDFNPISERLVFNINKKDMANISFQTNKANHRKREEIKTSIRLSDIENKPLLANFAISVTADNDVKPDTCVNILSTLLLTSDIRGHIESPAYYFSNKPNATDHLDILMLTQGWRRYNIVEVLKGNIEEPKQKHELSQEISGRVKGGLLLNKDAVDYQVTLLSLGFPFFDMTTTNKKGEFSFNYFELPDSTEYVVQARTKKGGKRAELTVKEDTYPSVNSIFPAKGIENHSLFERYLKKAEEKFVLENGMRMIHLKEVTVTAQVEKRNKHWASSAFNEIWNSERLEKTHATDIYELLRRIPGLEVEGTNRVYISRYRRASSFLMASEPYILVDNMEMESSELGAIPPSQIEEIEVIKGAQTSVFGFRGANGVILITTKIGADMTIAKDILNVKTIAPLGYQIQKEFYSPRYETKEQVNNTIADLRSTIYWKPDAETSDNGKVDLSFFSADSPGSYSVVMEGVTSEGRLIYGVEKISIKE